MTLDKWLGEKVEKKQALKPSIITGPMAPQAPGGSSVCELCSYRGTPTQVLAHRQVVHLGTERYEIRKLVPDGSSFVVEDVTNNLARAQVRTQAREDQTGHFFQIWDRHAQKVIE